MCKNVVELGMPQITAWQMRISCWIHKATTTHSEYVILIDFPVYHWLHKHASELHYAYFSCLGRACYMTFLQAITVLNKHT
jgi:hypothetical protein